jgi:hypothetical protein
MPPWTPGHLIELFRAAELIRQGFHDKEFRHSSGCCLGGWNYDQLIGNHPTSGPWLLTA